MPKNQKTKDLHKVYIPAANGSSDIVLGVPFYGEPNSVCSQTYLVIGYDPDKHNFTKQECENIVTYIKTRFFRYLVSIKKKTQNGPRGVYQFVPLQDFSKPWTDADLYAKYELTEEEISWLRAQKRPGRPTFGKIILDRGLASDMTTAIRDFVTPCKVGSDRIDAALAIDAVIAMLFSLQKLSLLGLSQ